MQLKKNYRRLTFKQIGKHAVQNRSSFYGGFIEDFLKFPPKIEVAVTAFRKSGKIDAVIGGNKARDTGCYGCLQQLGLEINNYLPETGNRRNQTSAALAGVG